MSETASKEVTAGFHRDRALFLKKDNKFQRPAGSFNLKAFFFEERKKFFQVLSIHYVEHMAPSWHGSKDTSFIPSDTYLETPLYCFLVGSKLQFIQNFSVLPVLLFETERKNIQNTYLTST